MSTSDERIEKSATSEQSELGLRSAVRSTAREKYQDQCVQLNAETIGIACQLVDTDDPAAAVQEIVAAALDRWARVRIIERMARNTAEGSSAQDRLTKSAAAASRRER